MNIEKIPTIERRITLPSSVKLLMPMLSLSIALALSACSGGDNNTAEESAPANEVTETTVVETEVIAADPIVEPAPEVSTDTEAPTEAVETVATEPEVLAADTGAKIYELKCKVCHDQGLLDAPKYGDKAVWTTRLTKGKETLYMHSAKGFNKMPAQAVNDVNEAQVKAAVDYMLEAIN